MSCPRWFILRFINLLVDQKWSLPTSQPFKTSMLKAFKTKAASGVCDHSLEIDLFPFACLLETGIRLRGVENMYFSQGSSKCIASPKNCFLEYSSTRLCQISGGY